MNLNGDIRFKRVIQGELRDWNATCLCAFVFNLEFRQKLSPPPPTSYYQCLYFDDRIANCFESLQKRYVINGKSILIIETVVLL